MSGMEVVNTGKVLRPLDAIDLREDAQLLRNERRRWTNRCSGGGERMGKRGARPQWIFPSSCSDDRHAWSRTESARAPIPTIAADPAQYEDYLLKRRGGEKTKRKKEEEIGKSANTFDISTWTEQCFHPSGR